MNQSRRTFLRRAAAFAMAAPVLGLVSQASTAQASTIRVSPSLAPVVARAIHVALPAEPASLNPLIQTGLVEASVQMNIFDGLAALDADGAPQPALAESWAVLDDQTWEFRLRPGVSFHNGEPFDSAAVRFTVETMLDPASGSPVRSQLSAIDRVDTPDPLVARIVTREPFAPLLAEITALAMVPPGHTASVGMDGLSRQPIGTGPFQFVQWDHAERIALGAYQEHWRGAPALDDIEFRPIPEGATRLAALQTGEVDLATNIAADQADTVTSGGFQLLTRPGIQTLYVRLNARRPPLDDVRVRQALACAIDVDTIIANLYGGHARRVSAPFPPDVFGYDANVAPVPYDPDRARTLLVEAGHGDGIALTFETPQGRYPGDAEVPLAIAGYLERVGVHTNIVVLEWATYLQKVSAGKGEDLFLLAGTNRTFDPHFTMARLYANASNFGHNYYGNPDIDPLVAEAAATLDRSQREALYHRLLDMLRADVPAIWLAQLDDLYGASPGLAWQPRADSLLWLDDARLG
jgi:peptide/nickel transport system substrate-binding protein